jgi:hypothetical protein
VANDGSGSGGARSRTETVEQTDCRAFAPGARVQASPTSPARAESQRPASPAVDGSGQRVRGVNSDRQVCAVRARNLPLVRGPTHANRHKHPNHEGSSLHLQFLFVRVCDRVWMQACKSTSVRSSTHPPSTFVCVRVGVRARVLGGWEVW